MEIKEWSMEARVHRLVVGPLTFQVEPRAPRLWVTSLLVGDAPAVPLGVSSGSAKKAKHIAESFLAGIMLASHELAESRAEPH